jgi:hypothetical protein
MAMRENAISTPYRISGHESFPCRYTWLPKAVRAVKEDPSLLSDDNDRAMVTLGLGKNMVRSVRFWSQAAGVATPAGKRAGHSLTDFGSAVFGERGYDPFLEDIRTLWLIHWNFSTDIRNPLLAWDYLLNRWHEPELVPSVVQRAMLVEATLPFREIAHGHGSPGQIFKLPEDDIRHRLEQLAGQTDLFAYTQSASLEQVRRREPGDRARLLKRLYQTEMAHA